MFVGKRRNIDNFSIKSKDSYVKAVLPYNYRKLDVDFLENISSMALILFRA